MSETTKKTKWELSQTAFDKLLFSLDDEREIAAEKYLALRKHLIRFFEIRHVSESEEACDETLDRLAKKLESGEVIENASIYALGIARLIVLEVSKKPKTQPLEEIPEPGFSTTQHKENHKDSQLKCLDTCLREISVANQKIIIGYYQGEKRTKIENRQKLAVQLNIPQNALRNRAVRLRNNLEVCILDCMKN